MKFKVEPKIFQKFPGIRIGVLVILGMDNNKNKEEAAELLQEEEKRQNQILQTVDFGTLPETAEWRKIYEQFGSKPRDFRSSVEALLRRVRTGNPLPSINPLVDLYNYLSIKYYLPAGAEDLDKVIGDIELTFAIGQEKGKYIGSQTEENCYQGEVIYKDNLGFICRRWNWREGDRTKIEVATKNAVLVLEALPVVSEEKFNQALNEAQELIKNLLGGDVLPRVLTQKDTFVEIDFKTRGKEKVARSVEKKVKVTFKEEPKIVIGKILKVTLLKAKGTGLYTVDVGLKTPVSIVCGDPNLQKDYVVAVALPGSHLNLPNGEVLTVGQKEIQGVVSKGIICSPLELGIGKDYYKELILPSSLEKYLGKPLKDHFQAEGVAPPASIKEKKVKPVEVPASKIFSIDKNSLTYKLREEIYKVVVEVAGKQVLFADVQVEHPAEMGHGDYATNVGMAIFKKFEIRPPIGGSKLEIKTPLDLADLIARKWKEIGLPDYASKIEVAHPGFLNLWLQNDYLVSQLQKVLKEKDRFGSSGVLEGKKILLEHTSPNPQTTIMLGHLRNNFLGMSIANILSFLGAKVTKDCIVNDRGVHICRAIWGYLVFAKKKSGLTKDQLLNFKEISNEQIEKIITGITWRDLLNEWIKERSGWLVPEDLGIKPDHTNLIWYVLGSRAYDLSEKVKNQVEEILLTWEREDKRVWQVWRQILDWSAKGYEETYKRVGSVHDWVWHESDHYKMGKDIVEEGLRKGVFLKSQGAIVTNLTKFGLPDTVVVKADETALYITQDLALTKLKTQKFPSDLYIWDIGAEQTLYFRQLFGVIEQLGISSRDKLFHLAYALINFKGGGKMATRKGDVVKADEILDLLKSRAKEIIATSNQELRGRLSSAELENLAEKVAVGAIKYSLLKYSRDTTIYFDPEESLSLEGNSAPYLQYTYTRTQSVLKKAGKLVIQDENFNIQFNQEEVAILRTVYQFPEIVNEAARQYAPNLICNFLFDLTQKFNLFYDRHRILVQGEGGAGKDQSQFRLLLTAVVGQVIKNGLSLLGIETVEKM